MSKNNWNWDIYGQQIKTQKKNTLEITFKQL